MTLAEELAHACSLFRNLPAAEVARLLDSYGYGLREYPPQSFVARQGEACRGLLVLCQGRVNATMTNKEGRQVTVEQLAEGDVLAPAFVFASQGTYPVNIVSMTPCRVLVIHRETLVKMLHDSETMMANYLAEISDKCAGLTMRLKEFALTSLRDRVMHYLRQRREYGRQQDMADRFGVARQSLNRVLQELAAEGFIQMEHGRIMLRENQNDHHKQNEI